MVSFFRASDCSEFGTIGTLVDVVMLRTFLREPKPGPRRCTLVKCLKRIRHVIAGAQQPRCSHASRAVCSGLGMKRLAEKVLVLQKSSKVDVYVRIPRY